jgi:hypothetical protein
MKKIAKYNWFTQNSRGFSLLEVLLGVSVFMIGMLGVTALNISSMKSNTFSGNLSEATVVAASTIEELMNKHFDLENYPPDCEDTDVSVPAGADFNKSYSDWIADFGGCFDLSDRDDDGNRTTNRDSDDDGADDGGNNFGLDDFGTDADYGPLVVTKNNITYNVYWNVAENEPVSVTPQRTKVINVIVEWRVKDEPRRISMSTIRQKE